MQFVVFQNGTGAGFSLNTSVFPVYYQLICPKYSYITDPEVCDWSDQLVCSKLAAGFKVRKISFLFIYISHHTLYFGLHLSFFLYDILCEEVLLCIIVLNEVYLFNFQG